MFEYVKYVYSKGKIYSVPKKKEKYPNYFHKCAVKYNRSRVMYPILILIRGKSKSLIQLYLINVVGG